MTALNLPTESPIKAGRELVSTILQYFPNESTSGATVDVEPACQHWFDTPTKGLWSWYPFKKLNEFYTLINTLVYAVYKIILLVVEIYKGRSTLTGRGSTQHGRLGPRPQVCQPAVLPQV
jgi:hypothetical protein